VRVFCWRWVQAVVVAPRIAMSLRLGLGDWHYIRLHVEDMTAEEMWVPWARRSCQ
jgi:hypothetical protein